MANPGPFPRTGDPREQEDWFRRLEDLGNDDSIDWDQVDKTGSSIADLASKSHTLLDDKGTNTHAQIDTHIASTANPHSVTAGQVGALAISNNLSDVADAPTSRTNLGLGSIATQDANSVAITGGAVDGTTVGSTTAAAGKFTTLEATGIITHDDTQIKVATVSTTDATVTTIHTEALADESAYLIVANVVGKKDDSTDRATYIRRILVYRDGGGVATVQGAVDNELTVESNASWDCTITVDGGNNAIVTVTGVAATNITWNARIHILSVT